MTQHCCKILDLLLTDEERPIDYIPKRRLYDLSVSRIYLKKNEVKMGYDIEFCPFCGKKFPLDLSEVWEKVLEEKFGELHVSDKKLKAQIPQEFLTDAWWKNGDYEITHAHLMMTMFERIVKSLEEHNIKPDFDKGEFCCFGMNSLMDDDYLDCPLQYIPHRRFYMITTPEYYAKRRKKPAVYTIFYCPRCGAKLPDDLSSLWYTIVKKKFGSPLNAPAEFLTDRWWKDGNV